MFRRRKWDFRAKHTALNYFYTAQSISGTTLSSPFRRGRYLILSLSRARSRLHPAERIRDSSSPPSASRRGFTRDDLSAHPARTVGAGSNVSRIPFSRYFRNQARFRNLTRQARYDIRPGRERGPLSLSLRSRNNRRAERRESPGRGGKGVEEGRTTTTREAVGEEGGRGFREPRRSER